MFNSNSEENEFLKNIPLYEDFKIFDEPFLKLENLSDMKSEKKMIKKEKKNEGNDFEKLSEIQTNNTSSFISKNQFINSEGKNYNKIIKIGKKTKRSEPTILIDDKKNNKKKLFKTKYQNELSLFEIGTFNAYSEKMINEALNQNKNNNLNLINDGIYRSDRIRRKYFSKFFKYLIDLLNMKFNFSKPGKSFDYLPDRFIRKFTSSILEANRKKKIVEVDMTIEKIISHDFCIIKKENTKVLQKIDNNKSLLDDLKKNKNKYEESKFFILKQKFSEVLNEYLKSKRFGKDIIMMRKDNIYIQKYINQIYKLKNILSENN